LREDRHDSKEAEDSGDGNNTVMRKKSGLVLGLAVALLTATTFARPGPVPSPEQLTQTLITLIARYQRAGAAEQRQLLHELLTVAANRQRALAALIETDPGAVLRVAVPASLRVGLPPVVQAYLEEEVEIEGVLEVLHEDRDHGSRYLYFVEAAGERFSLHFAAEPPALQTGTRVRIKGVRVGRSLAL
jgi:hypothetical protein